MDHELWAEAVGTVFKNKWQNGSRQRLDTINDIRTSAAGVAPAISRIDLIMAVDLFRKPHVLDSYGVSPSGIRCMVLAYPDASARLFSALVSQDDFFSGMEIHGHVAAKKRGIITAEQTRAIVPFPTSLALIDIVVANMLEKCVETFASTVGHSCLEVAK